MCYKSLNSGSDDFQIAIHLPDVKLSNPKILSLTGFGSTDALIIYQTNEGNDININYFTFKTDGTISKPVVLSNLPGDDINVTTSYSGIVAWENSGKIYVSKYRYESSSFSEPFAVDSAGAYCPVLASYSNLNYLKKNGDSTTIFSIKLFYKENENSWGVNEIITKSFNGIGSNLASGRFVGGAMANQNKIGTNPNSLVLFPSGIPSIEFQNSTTYNLSQPSIIEYQIRVKSKEQCFLAYVTDSLGRNEIFIENPYGYNIWPQNISQWPEDDRNPRFFETWLSMNEVRLYLLWESERKGHSSIFYSICDYPVYGGIDKNPKTESIIAYPCPFERQTAIRFKATGKTNVSILDLQGRQVKELLTQMDADGWQNAMWDGTDNYGNSVPSGSFVIHVRSEKKAESRIIIKKQ